MTEPDHGAPGLEGSRSPHAPPPPSSRESGLDHGLESRLHPPRLNTDLVPRPRLTRRIDAGLEGRLVLVSAPPGFGKTTLLAEWLAASRGTTHAVAWVSLDAADNEPLHFWSGVIRAFQQIDPTLGTEALERLQARPLAARRPAIATLLRDLEASEPRLALVLDDLHLVETPDLYADLAHFLDHLPPRTTLLLASRSDPPLPLGRLRVRGELTEIRAVDLRFDPGEVGRFVKLAMDPTAADDLVAALGHRTEGWIAGLRLAALSMRVPSTSGHAVEGGGADRERGGLAALVASFSGHHRHISDYLMEEVLEAQPEPLRRFLLDTSILDRLSGPLCDAVTDEAGSQEALEALEARNVFVVALDDRRTWYRYHHLFADFLRGLAARRDPERVRTLHGRAAGWYENRGRPAEAAAHALSGEAWDAAARILERSPPTMDRQYASRRWMEQVRMLPEPLVHGRPRLCMDFAWALLNGGELESAESTLARVEGWLHAPGRIEGGGIEGEPTPAPLQESRLHFLPEELRAARLYSALSAGRTEGTLDEARRSLALIPEDLHAERAKGTALLGLAAWAEGRLEEGFGIFARSLTLMKCAGDPLSAVRGVFVLGDIRVEQGRLSEAQALYEAGLREAAELARTASPETDELHLGLSAVHLERGEVDAAALHLQTLADEAGGRAFAGNASGWSTAMARLCQVQGAFDEAMGFLDQAEARLVRSPLPRPRPLGTLRARLHLAQGRPERAKAWVEAEGLRVDDEIRYLREFDYLTLARVLLGEASGASSSQAIDRASGEASDRASGKVSDTASDRPSGKVSGHENPAEVEPAVFLLERLADHMHRAGRLLGELEARLLLARAHHGARRPGPAAEALERALTIGEAEGMVTSFIEGGPAIRALLRRGAAQGAGGDFGRSVLEAFSGGAAGLAAATPRGAGGGMAASPPGASPLTARELEVLRLVAAGERTAGVAEILGVRPATVKRHLANIHLKLGVGHRTAAVARGRALGLL